MILFIYLILLFNFFILLITHFFRNLLSKRWWHFWLIAHFYATYCQNADDLFLLISHFLCNLPTETRSGIPNERLGTQKMLGGSLKPRSP